MAFKKGLAHYLSSYLLKYQHFLLLKLGRISVHQLASARRPHLVATREVNVLRMPSKAGETLQQL
jgi:hypothetical protein